MIPIDKHMYIYVYVYRYIYIYIFIYIYIYIHIWFNHQHVGYYKLPKTGPVTMAFRRRPIEARSSERCIRRRRCRRALLLGRRCAVQARRGAAERSWAGRLRAATRKRWTEWGNCWDNSWLWLGYIGIMGWLMDVNGILMGWLGFCTTNEEWMSMNVNECQWMSMNVNECQGGIWSSLFSERAKPSRISPNRFLDISIDVMKMLLASVI